MQFVNPLPGMHRFKSQLLYYQSNFLFMCLGKQLKMVQVLESLPPMWEIQIEFQAPISAWPNLACRVHLGNASVDRRSISPSLSLSLSNRYILKKKKKVEAQGFGLDSESDGEPLGVLIGSV